MRTRYAVLAVIPIAVADSTIPPLLWVRLAKRGEPRRTQVWFPLLAGGNLKLKGVGFLPSALAYGVGEYDGSNGMRARRSRTQRAPCWERGRPACNRSHPKKTYPHKGT